jgi:hypothetical protein
MLSNRKFYSSFARYLFKLGSGGWEINNDTNILNKGLVNPTPYSKNCYKILITEKVDEIIEVHSSLMTGVARAVVGRKACLRPGDNDFYLSK